MIKNFINRLGFKYLFSFVFGFFLLLSFPHSVFAARTITGATLNGAATVTVPPSTVISASIDVTTSGGGAAGRWRGTTYQIGASPAVCVDHPNHDSAGSYNEVFSITAPAGLGVYNVVFIAYDNSACSSGASSSFTLTSGITVAAPTNTPTPTFTPTPIPPTPTDTPTPTPTDTPTPTPTDTPTPTPIPPTPTDTPTPTPTDTPTPTPTPVGTRTITSATLNGLASVEVIPSTLISASVDVTTTGSGASADWGSTSWQIGAGPTNCVDHPNHSVAGSYTEPFSITGPASNGTYDVHFVAFSDNACSTDASSTFTLVGGVVVVSPTATPTPTNTPTPTDTPTPTPIPPTDTPTPTPIPPTDTPTPTPIPPTDTPTPTPTPLGTRTITNALLDGSSTVTTSPSNPVATSVDVTTAGSGGSAVWGSTSWQIDAGPTTCENHPNHNVAGSYNEPFVITAPGSIGSYDVHFVAYSDDACSTDASATFTLVDGIVVASPTPTPSVTATPVPTDTPTPTPTNTPTPTPASARTVTSVTLNGLSSVVVAPLASISTEVSVTTTGVDPLANWGSTSWQIGAGATTCVDHANHTTAGSYQETFNITAPPIDNVYNVHFLAYSDDACSLNSSTTFTITGGVTVLSPTATPTPSPTPLDTPTPTPTATPTPTPEPPPTATPTPSGSRTITGSTLNGLSSVTVDPSSLINASVDVTTTGSGGTADWGSTSWQIGTGEVICANHPNHSIAGSYTEAFMITAPAAEGIYDVKYQAFSDDACTSDQSLIFTLSNGVTIITPTATPTPTPSNTPTPTPIPPTNTPTPTPTNTPIPTPTNTPAPTDTPTPTPIPPTPTDTPAVTSTPAPTDTPAPGTPTPTEIPTTPTSTPTPGQFCGNGICETSISENCSVCSLDCGICPAASPTPTGVPASTNTPTPGPTNTPAASATPGPTATATPTATPTPTPFIDPAVAVNPIDGAPQTGARVEVAGTFARGTLPVSRVEVTFDDGLTWFLAPLTDNDFSVVQEDLEDGNYPVRARVTDTEGNVSQSDTQTLLIDNLPPIIGGSAFTFGPQILSPDESGLIRVSANTQITTALSTRGGVTKAEVTSDNEIFPLVAIPGTNIWTGNISFNDPGVKDLVVTAEDGVGKTTERSVGALIVEPVGRVTNENETQPITNAIASVFFYDRNSQAWGLWDGESYGQTNPKQVADDGSYSFIVPAGRYYVQIDAPGRRRAQSNIFDFTTTSILNANFRTTPLLNIFSNFFPPDISTSLNRLTENRPTQNILGTSMPDFELPSSNSTADVTSDSYIGKKTVFTFISTWAPESVSQAQILQKLQSQISTGQETLAIALQETPSAAETFLNRGGYDFPLVSDLNGYTAYDYKVGALPYHVFIDTTGRIRETYSGLLHESEIINKLNRLQ